MDRAAAMSLLTEKYRELATDAKFTGSQTTDAYNGAIDMSLRQLQVSETDLATYDVAQVNIIKYIALLNYYALSRFSTLQSIRYDVELPGPLKASRNQAFQAIQTLLKAAEAELANLGIIISSASTVQMGELQLDFLEPSCPGGWF